MRKVIKLGQPGGEYGLDDWKATPEEVLTTVDQLLEAHGLEVLMIDNGEDSVQYKIVRRI